MKKLLLAALVASTLGFAGLATAATPVVSSGTITVNGKIVSSTCTVTANGQQNPTITLPTLDTNSLPAGASAGWTALTFSVTGCSAVTNPAATSLSTYFSSVNVDSTTGYLKNTTAGGSNVEIVLSNSQTAALGAGNGLALNAPAGSQNTPVVAIPGTTTGIATFNYYVGYVAGTSAATAGAVNTTVQYALSYQ
ncbi:fimbrial protein [Dyella japonica]|nr:fimbrial protein [Dyella japonica]